MTSETKTTGTLTLGGALSGKRQRKIGTVTMGGVTAALYIRRWGAGGIVFALEGPEDTSPDTFTDTFSSHQRLSTAIVTLVEAYLHSDATLTLDGEL